VRFFLLAVFATMYVRDHARPAFHEALGIDPTEYDRTVYRITSDITRQVFPLTLDIDNPRFHAGLERFRRINEEAAAIDASGAAFPRVRKAGLAVRAGFNFLRMFMLPAHENDIPEESRLVPAW
jgi:magnesium-protoporphyrin IX monomethyl ester (oxidative) cyclase